MSDNLPTYEDDARFVITGLKLNRIIRALRAGAEMNEFVDDAKAILHLIGESECFVNAPADPDAMDDYTSGEHLLDKLTRESRKVKKDNEWSGELDFAITLLDGLEPAFRFEKAER